MSQSTIYDQATSAVVKMLEAAGTDWYKPWQVNGSRNIVTDKLYRGVNTLILGSTPYPSGAWGTFRQWKQLGHPVRKGQKSTGIAFFKPVTKETVRPDGRTEEENYMVIRSYNVFAAEQVTGYPIEVPDATMTIIGISKQKTISGILVPGYRQGLTELTIVLLVTI